MSCQWLFLLHTLPVAQHGQLSSIRRLLQGGMELVLGCGFLFALRTFKLNAECGGRLIARCGRGSCNSKSQKYILGKGVGLRVLTGSRGRGRLFP
jgi:hypothetical protein